MQTRISICYLPTQSMDEDEDSEQYLTSSLAGYVKMGVERGACYMYQNPIWWLVSFQTLLERKVAL